MRLIKKEILSSSHDRWDLEVKKTHNFVANRCVVHNSNARFGTALDSDESGQPVWTWMCGSHDIRRKEFYSKTKRFELESLIVELGIPCPVSILYKVGDVINHENRYYLVDNIEEKDVEVTVKDEDNYERTLTKMGFPNKGIVKKTFLHTTLVEPTESGHTPKLFRSKYWEPLNENVQQLLSHIRDNFPWPDRKFSVIIYGEIFGSGVQSMAYGLENGFKSFRVFDIAINNKYLDFDTKKELLIQFGVEMVPVLYRGPFSKEVLDKHTSGPTTLCDPSKAGSFKGREGVVVVPVKERITPEMTLTSTNGRVILKSVSADYLSQKDMSDGH